MSNVEKMMELIKEKKAKVTTPEDMEKVDHLEKVLVDSNLYYMISPGVFMGILKFLDVPDEDLENVYFEMINPTDFKKNNNPEVRKIIGE